MARIHGSRSITLTVLLVLLGACASSEAWYVPRESGGALAPDGQPAASFTLVQEAGGAAIGRLRLWARATNGASGESVELRVGFELENRSEHVVALDAETARLVTVDVESGSGRAMGVARPRGEGEVEVVPHAVGRGVLVFDVPVGSGKAHDLLGFTLEWGVREVDGEGRFGDMASFARGSGYAYRRAHYYYDPWYGPYW